MILSIIIPFHDTILETEELLKVLIPQLTNECELIIVDDDVNTYELDNYKSDRIKVIHHKLNSGCAGVPRNTGLDNAQGQYITFIDSDDMVTADYVEKILNKINNSNFDYCLFSWRYKTGQKVIIKDNPPSWNTSVWNCIYKNTEERFNTDRIAEDYDFNLRTRKGKKENIEDILYIYNFGREGSITNLWKK